MDPFWCPLGHPWVTLGTLWAPLGPSWVTLGPFDGPLGPTLGALGDCWSSWGSSWGLLGTLLGGFGVALSLVGGHLGDKLGSFASPHRMEGCFLHISSPTFWMCVFPGKKNRRRPAHTARKTVFCTDHQLSTQVGAFWNCHEKGSDVSI